MSRTTANPDGECYFSSDIPDILVTNDNDYLTFVVRREEDVLINDEYTGEDVRIRFLSSSLSPHLHPGRNVFVFSLRNNSHIDIQGSFEVIRCDIAVSPPDKTREFESSCFLSTFSGVKRTNLRRREYLSLCGSIQAQRLTVRFAGIYADNQGNETVIRKETETEVPPLIATTLDVSPALYDTEKDKRLCEYAITIGGRYQTFVVMPSPPFEKEFVFVNPFGVLESVGFIGGETFEEKRERDYGTVGGDYRVLSHRSDTEYTCHSGILRKHEADWIRSMLSSTEIIETETERAITILEEKMDRSSRFDELPALELKYRYSGLAPMLKLKETKRIFTLHYTREYE